VSQRNLSIFNSKVAPRLNYRSLIVIGAWVIFSLAAIDIFINVIFAYPSNPKAIDPSRLQLFFEYGRSAEGALSRMTRRNRSETAPITLAGWYNPLIATDWPAGSVSVPGEAKYRPIVTIYGASHSVRLAVALARVSNQFSSRSIGAPGATPNWSYAAYLRDRGGGNSVAVVLSFNANELAMITSLSPAVWSSDYPMPYTADRFYLYHGQLEAIHPPYDSFEEYQRAFFDPQAWSKVVDFLSKNDPLYDPILFRANVLDHSSLFRLVRRAYAQNRQRTVMQEVLNKSGFHPDSEGIKVARAIIHDFAKQARADGMVPVIYLVNNLGYSDNLFRALKPALDADSVPYVSSHLLVSPNDPRGFLPDSHFTDDNDDRLAAELERIIKTAR
jgi:hypothetical protein